MDRYSVLVLYPDLIMVDKNELLEILWPLDSFVFHGEKSYLNETSSLLMVKEETLTL